MFIATNKEKKGNKVRVYKRWGPQFGRFFLFFLSLIDKIVRYVRCTM